MERRILSAAAFETLLKSLVAVFAAWTIVYQIVLATRWPAYLAIVMWLAALAATAAVLIIRRRSRAAARRDGEREPAAVIAGVLAVSLLCAYFSLVVSRPDWDDIGFFHRPLVQGDHLGDPIILGDTTHNVSGLPGLPSVHLMASYEMLVSFLGRLSGVDALSLYQNGACAFASFLLPIVYFLLFRKTGLAAGASLVAMAASVTFLWFDGNLHASIGNYAFVRLWQGKCILLTLLFPVIVLLIVDVWQRGTRAAWALLFLSTIAAVGLSGTAIVEAPVLVFIVSSALFIEGVYTKRAPLETLFARAVVVNLASIYCVLLAAGFLSGVIPPLRDIANAPEARWFAESWWANLSTSIGPAPSVAWYAALLLVGPWLAGQWNAARLAVLSAAIGVIICFNPATGPHWLNVLFNSYWRLVFVLPIAFAAGLTGAGIAKLVASPRANLASAARLVAAVILAVLFATHFQQATFAPSNHAYIKAPFEYRFDPAVLPFCKAAAPELDGRTLLAEEDIVTVLPLLNRSIRVEAQRPWVTHSFFRDAGRQEEGLSRTRAQSVVLDGKRNAARDASFRAALADGVDSIVARDKALPAVKELLTAAPGSWRAAYHQGAYTLLLKD